MSKESLFLDTSIQISRQGADKEEVKNIEELLAGDKFLGTSTYTRLEFKQSYVQDLIWLHRECVLEEKLSAVILKTQKLNSHPGHRRKISNVLNALSRYYSSKEEFISGDQEDLENAEKIGLYLEIILEDIFEWFDGSIDYLSDCIECIRGVENIRKKKIVFDGRVGRCKSEKIRCKLAEYFETKKDDFNKILTIIESIEESKKKKPGELKRIAETIKKGLQDPKSICNTKDCRNLGDALIAVEGRSFKTLFTKDIDQANIIAPAIKLNANLYS